MKALESKATGAGRIWAGISGKTSNPEEKLDFSDNSDNY
jgi:hypothetical protein